MRDTRTTTSTTTRPEPGWYPDYDAEPGWQRYWNGAEWTEGRREWVGGERRVRAGVRIPVRGYVAAAAAAGVVAATVGVLVLGNDEPATSGGVEDAAGARVEAGVPPPPASTPGPPPSEAGAPAATRQTWAVASVVDGRTLALSNGATVRLLGVGGGCATGAASSWLAARVQGDSVRLVRGGVLVGAGHLLRYATDHGDDVGLEMIRAGVATAVGGHTRATAYAAADAGCR